MKTNYTKGTLEIDLHSLLESVAPEHRVDLIESLSCDEEIIRHVADQIISRWTENVYSGASWVTAPSDDTRGCALDVAWRRVAKASGEVAKREIERLESALKSREDEIARLNLFIHELHQRRRSY